MVGSIAATGIVLIHNAKVAWVPTKTYIFAPEGCAKEDIKIKGGGAKNYKWARLLAESIDYR